MLNEFLFHATSVYASGGMTLSGDDLTTIPPDRLALLRKLLPPTGIAAEFEDDSLRVGVTKLPDWQMVSLFNWGAAPQTLSFRLPAASRHGLLDGRGSWPPRRAVRRRGSTAAFGATA